MGGGSAEVGVSADDSGAGADLPTRPTELWTQQPRGQNRWPHWPGFGLEKSIPHPSTLTPGRVRRSHTGLCAPSGSLDKEKNKCLPEMLEIHDIRRGSTKASDRQAIGGQ